MVLRWPRAVLQAHMVAGYPAIVELAGKFLVTWQGPHCKWWLVREPPQIISDLETISTCQYYLECSWLLCCLHTRPSFDNVCFSMLFHSVQVIPPCSMEIRTARNFLMLENLDYLPVYVYYVYYMSIYTYVRVTCMWIIYIYTQYSIYIYIYILYVHGWTCI